MDWLEHPSDEVWESRQHWFEEVGESYQGEGSYFVSEQACALIGEVQTAFCAGAWLAVIMLAMAVVDSQLREFTPGFAGSTKRLLMDAQVNPKLQQLRKRRNAIIHFVDAESPAITVDQQWTNRKELEQDAKQAVELMFEAFYSDPGT